VNVSGEGWNRMSLKPGSKARFTVILVIAGAATIGTTLGVVFMDTPRVGRIIGCALWLVAVGLMAWTRLTMRLTGRAVRRRAAASDDMLCPFCHYDLRGCEASGRCPECGQPFVPADVREWWKDFRAGCVQFPTPQPPMTEDCVDAER
jgi:hypothetical protein